jgi:hypothetical protein
MPRSSALTALSSRGNPRGLLAVAFALFCALGQILGVAHYSLVPHSPCATHGEPLEGAAPAPAGEAPSPALSRQAALASSHGHAHCLVAGPRQEVLEPASVPSPGFAAEHPQAPATSPQSLSAVATLHLAPKLSPPLAGRLRG